MTKNILIVLSCLIAIVGGAGLYVVSALVMNLILAACLGFFGTRLLSQYNQDRSISIRFEYNQFLILLLYIGFLMANVLKETFVDTEFRFNFTPEGGIIRDYIDVFRGLVVYMIAKSTYSPVKNSKIFIFLPVICLFILLIGQLLEANGLIDPETNTTFEGRDWTGNSFSEKLLRRPGGFLNANMTAGVALIWLFVTLESKLERPVVIKGLALLTALSICVLTQSRSSIIFLSLYLLHNIIVTRNFKFLLTLVSAAVGIIILLNTVEIDLVTGLIEKFMERADSKEESAMEREAMIFRAIETFQDSPIFGNGLYHLARTYEVASHNQTLEILTNYGIVGFFATFSLYFGFYHKNNIPYLLLCIFPMLIFSHNFFENSAFQVALAFGYIHAGDDSKEPLDL